MCFSVRKMIQNDLIGKDLYNLTSVKSAKIVLKEERLLRYSDKQKQALGLQLY